MVPPAPVVLTLRLASLMLITYRSYSEIPHHSGAPDSLHITWAPKTTEGCTISAQRETAACARRNNSAGAMARLLTEFLLLATASGYTLRPRAEPTRQSPAATPMMAQPAVAPEITKPEDTGIEVDRGAVVANGGFGIQPLTTVPELEEAMAAAHSAGRLCVVKFYAPWCTACKAIQPKFKKLARAYPEHDFYEVDFSRCKPLSKHCDITNLPTGIILEQGKLARDTWEASPHTPRHTRGCAARSRLGSAHETRQGAPSTLTLTLTLTRQAGRARSDPQGRFRGLQGAVGGA